MHEHLDERRASFRGQGLEPLYLSETDRISSPFDHLLVPLMVEEGKKIIQAVNYNNVHVKLVYIKMYGNFFRSLPTVFRVVMIGILVQCLKCS